MKKKAGMLAVLLAAAFAALPAIAGADRTAKASGSPAASTAAGTTPAKPAAGEPLTGDAAYKSNCLRCHGEPRKVSERAMKTIMRHMRVRANLTEQETELILEYLTR